MCEQNDRSCFVPFCDKVIWRYEKLEDAPGHDKLRRELCSGEIHVTLTARTPICVGGGKRWKEGQMYVALFARNAQNDYCIPGSTLRGLIRQNMQILGLGTVRAGEDVNSGPMANGKMAWEGVPREYKVRNDLRLDYPRAVMGFVRKVNKNGKEQMECYRSRVSVGSLTAKGAPKELITWPVNLDAPKVDAEKFICRKTDGSFRLSGTRQYPMKSAAPDGGYWTRQGIRPLAAGTRFSGVIRYRNLAADELGLLLWCLRLEPGCGHTIGMAKSYGCGQVELTIDRLVEYDTTALYGSLTACGTVLENPQQWVAELIETYKTYASRRIGGVELARMPHIQKFLELKHLPVQTAVPDAPKSVPAPKKKVNKKDIEPRATAAEVSDMRAQLSNWFKKN